MDKQTSKIHDEAQRKAVKDIALTLWFVKSHPDCDIIALANRIYNEHLSLSGTTDIECPECEGKKGIPRMWHGHHVETLTCPKCDGTGIIKHKWKIAVVLENGELPSLRTIPRNAKETKEIKITIPTWWDDVSLESYLGRIHQQDMLNAKYRQVVE